jgi:hypothetical protein
MKQRMAVLEVQFRSQLWPRQGYPYSVTIFRTALAGNAPEPRAVEPPDRGRVVAVPYVGGLHRSYRRVA